MTRSLNFRHLEAFVAVAAAGNFTRAAQSLHISQPALTVQIRQLEASIGARLLDRNTRSVKLTKIGQQLSPVVRRLLREIESVVDHAHEMAAGRRGAVTVAALPSVCSMVLPRLIAMFRERHPGIVVAMKDAVSQKVLAMVKNEEVDFGIGGFTGADPALRIVPLFQDRMKAVFPPHHPLSRKRILKLQDLTGFPLILIDPQSSVRMLVDRAFESIGHFPAPAYEVNYMSSAVGMVRAGLGVAFLPSSTLELAELGGLSARAVQHPGLTREIVAVLKPGRAPSPAAASLLEVLVAGCREYEPPRYSGKTARRRHAAVIKSDARKR